MSKNRVWNPTTIFAVLFAFLAWGSWAYYVNREGHEFSDALKWGLTQGIYSAAMTFYMSFSVQTLLKKCSANSWSWLLPTVGTVGHTGILLVLVHWLNGTPNIAKTVAAPLTVACSYCLFLTRQLRRS